MLNNKAQSLVIFVLFLPVILLFLIYVFDILSINYHQIKLDSITNIVVEEGKLDEELNVCELVKNNDSDIECIVSDKKIELKKKAWVSWMMDGNQESFNNYGKLFLKITLD